MVLVNNQTFRGQLEVEAVFNGVCAGFHDPPRICNRVLDENDFHNVSTIFF